MNQQGGARCLFKSFNLLCFKSFRTRRSRLGGGTCKRRWKSKLGGVHRQKNQPGTSTKLGRRISKCGSETRSTNARFKGKIHEGDCTSWRTSTGRRWTWSEWRPSGEKLVADLLSKIIAVKPNWERFWRFVNRQGSGVPNEEPTIGSNRCEEQPLGEEHHPEEPDQETSSWDNYRVIAGRCVSVVKKVVGLAKEYPELAEFRHEALSTAIGRLVQVLADAYRVTESVVKDRFQLESVLPFLEKKNIPAQVEHPVEEEPRGILKRGNRSKRGNSKPKRVHFWNENPPILKVLRVQDHHGHVTQLHSSGKEEPIPKTILGDGQEKHWDLDLARSNRKEHRAAEDVPRSGPTETRDQVAVRGMEFLGSVVKIDEIQLHGKPSKGIAPQPMGTQGDQKEKEARILLQVGTEKEKKKKKRIKKG